MATTGAESQSDSNAHGIIEIPADEHSVGTFPPFDGETYASQILWLAITFGLLYWIMSKVALPRLSGILEDRRDRIAGDLARGKSPERGKQRRHRRLRAGACGSA